ncbi:MAG: B-box zinc finger protein [Planctomycetota bacterium]
MARLLDETRCRHHPDRPGYAACSQCRAVICQECATGHAGALFCRDCLQQQQQAADRRGRWDGPLPRTRGAERAHPPQAAGSAGGKGCDRPGSGCLAGWGAGLSREPG